MKVHHIPSCSNNFTFILWDTHEFTAPRKLHKQDAPLPPTQYYPVTLFSFSFFFSQVDHTCIFPSLPVAWFPFLASISGFPRRFVTIICPSSLEEVMDPSCCLLGMVVTEDSFGSTCFFFCASTAFCLA